MTPHEGPGRLPARWRSLNRRGQPKSSTSIRAARSVGHERACADLLRQIDIHSIVARGPGVRKAYAMTMQVQERDVRQSKKLSPGDARRADEVTGRMFAGTWAVFAN